MIGELGSLIPLENHWGIIKSSLPPLEVSIVKSLREYCCYIFLYTLLLLRIISVTTNLV